MKSLILYCNCSWSDVISKQIRNEVLEYLNASGKPFCAVDDLCRIAVDETQLLKQFSGVDKLILIACFPRTAKSLFASAGLDLPTDTTFLNMRKLSAQAIISKLDELTKNVDSDTSISINSTDKKGDWTPWFPVIDYQRCVNCKQCLNFCLFGVYELGEDGTVKVVRPANCKTNCPACARVCPHAAIIFPKYIDAPINGDEVDEEALKNADKSKALADLMEGDALEIIRSRSAKRKRFAPKNDADISDNDKAAKLQSLKDQLDIPQEVIDSLTNKKSSNNNCPNSKFCDKQCEGNKSDD